MDCQSGCPLNSVNSLISEETTCIRHALPRAVPQCGQRLEGQRLRSIVVLHRDAVSTVWQIACTLQTVMCARKAVGDVEVRGT